MFNAIRLLFLSKILMVITFMVGVPGLLFWDDFAPSKQQ